MQDHVLKNKINQLTKRVDDLEREAGALKTSLNGDRKSLLAVIVAVILGLIGVILT